MTARIISVVNQKGGAGKTTTSMVLSGELANRGARVLVCDADGQNTATRWAIAAPDEEPFPATVISVSSFGSKVHREVQKHIANYDYIIIDCPPSVESPIPGNVLLISHLAIVPIPPSPADLWSSRGIKSVIDKASDMNEGLKAYILINKPQRTTLSKAVEAELEEFGLPILKTRLSARTAYQEATIVGSTVAGLGKSAKPAADEVKSLADEVVKILEA